MMCTMDDRGVVVGRIVRRGAVVAPAMMGTAPIIADIVRHRREERSRCIARTVIPPRYPLGTPSSGRFAWHSATWPCAASRRDSNLPEDRHCPEERSIA
jgi:hypothetical protein